MRALLFFLCVLAQACSHVISNTTQSSPSGSSTCEQQLFDLSQRETEIRRWATYKTSAGVPASYVATGAAYTADVFVVVGRAVGKFVVMCPGSAFYLFATGHISLMTDVCPDFHVSSSHYGSSTFVKTKAWREGDLTEVSQSYRSVATCFQERSDQTSLQTAHALLDPLVRDSEFLGKVDDSERSQLIKQWEQLEKRVRTS